MERIPWCSTLAAEHGKRVRGSYGDFVSVKNHGQGKKLFDQVRESEIVSTHSSQLKIVDRTDAPSGAEEKINQYSGLIPFIT
jgi:hypothetical protein